MKDVIAAALSPLGLHVASLGTLMAVGTRRPLIAATVYSRAVYTV
jgi:hypothetical protein